jgi:predicted phosphodiesterase
MRYGIFSDVHANLEALQTVIEAYKKEAIDKYLCAGDIVGYASCPRECIEKVRTLTTVAVAGNHDWASVDLFSVEYFNHAAAKAIAWTKQNLDQDSRFFLQSLKLIYKNEDLTLTHGTLDNPRDFNYMTDGYVAEETFRLLDTNICFVGHTHVAGIFIKDKFGHMDYHEDNSTSIEDGKRYIINVGSVGQPRDGNPDSAYCIYDTDKKEVQIKRVSYDIKAVGEKIIAAGLPRFLADRLLRGM